MAMESYVQKRQVNNPLNLREMWSDAVVSAATDIGPYNKGDIIWNSSPDSGEYVGWICVTAGATGATSTWKGFGLIA